MIALYTDTPQFFSDLCEVVRVFDPGAEISLGGEGERLTHEHREEGGRFVETWSMGGLTVRHEAEAAHGKLIGPRMLKRAAKNGCFKLMMTKYGACPPWGSLTGIRPTRLLYEALESGKTMDEGVQWLQDTFFVSGGRARLLRDILDMQRGLIERSDDAFDVYVGIPFCVTRCAYCSFSSGTLGNGKLVEPYLAALFREMDACAEMTRRRGLRVRACYMGGGTPTSLTADQLARTLDHAMACFPGALEWTVEAGRPDTIDRAKLQALLDRNVGRISVNPQSFSDETLKLIGRAHTAEDTLRAYDLAKSMGVKHINMDLIAALPGEALEDFERTLEKTESLAPESITVHTLAIKHSSKLHELGYRQADDRLAADMVDLARARTAKAGYRPYYLYRQKYMAGNLENVGYAKPGEACVYNIDIMEETTQILALGAGAITKWLYPAIRRIERAANVKNIEAYIDRVDEMVERKRALIEREQKGGND